MKATEKLALDILILQGKRARDLEVLKTEASEAYQSLRPINLIKSTIDNMTHSPKIMGNLGKAAIGMVTGYLLKKIVFGSSKGVLSNSVGSMFQSLATNLATKNSDKLVEGGLSIFEIAKSLFTSNRTRDEQKLIND